MSKEELSITTQPVRKVSFDWESLFTSNLPLTKAQTLKESLTSTNRVSRWGNLRRKHDPEKKYVVTKDQVDRALGIIK